MENNKLKLVFVIGIVLGLLILPLVCCRSVEVLDMSKDNVKISVRKQIQNMAVHLAHDDKLDSVMEINNWVQRNINYSFYWFPRGYDKTWKTMKGDCTDRAELKCMMLNYIRIPCRTVHGYSYYFEDSDPVLHDWYEVKLNNTWTSFEDMYFYKLDRIGLGVW